MFERENSFARTLLLCLFSCLLSCPIHGVSTPNTCGLNAFPTSLRYRPPSTYAVNVDSYSKLVSTQTEKYESDVFEAGGYKWTLILYPTGNTKDNGADHISLYLAIYKPSSLPLNWEIYAEIKFFVYDKQRSRYLTVGDSDVQRFDVAKTKWGFGRLIELSTFKDANRGYLVSDSCQFGVEIVVLKPYQNSERLSFFEKPGDGKFGWKIMHFSQLDKNKFVYSDEFTVTGSKWKLRVAPGGDGDGWQNSLSIYVELSDTSNFRVNQRVYGRVNVRVLHHDTSKNVQKQLGQWFSQEAPAWGFQKFMPLGDLNDASKAYVVDDKLNIEVEFDLVSKTEYIP